MRAILGFASPHYFSSFWMLVLCFSTEHCSIDQCSTWETRFLQITSGYNFLNGAVHSVVRRLCEERRNEPPRDKISKVSVRPAKTQISLGIRPDWSQSSLSAWRKLGPLATHWAHSEDSDQTGRMPRLIWVFAGRTATLLVLSRGGSNVLSKFPLVLVLVFLKMFPSSLKLSVVRQLTSLHLTEIE